MTAPSHNKSPSYSPAARGFLDSLAGAKYPSQLRGRGPEIARAAASNSITVEEVDVVFRALEHCKDSLVHRTSGEFEPEVPENVPSPDQPWSPSGMIDESAQPREPDFRERQIPRGDRD